jgi:hypothetical protein
MAAMYDSVVQFTFDASLVGEDGVLCIVAFCSSA